MSLYVPAAAAENMAPPDKEQRKSMSYEEYSKYRENMRKQMEKINPEAAGQTTHSSGSSSENAEKSQRDSAYGQGYHSRPPSVERPDMGNRNIPERPRVERFNRGEMGRR